MRNSLMVVVFLLVVTSGQASGQNFPVGASVNLVERDIHIPAHPAPLNAAVPFRFAGGSQALILALDAPSGWIQVRGERVGGSEDVGWIVERYIDGLVADGPPPVDNLPLELAWCPEKGSSDPRPGRLRIATWNLGNLHAVNGQSIFGGQDPSVKRSRSITCESAAMYDSSTPTFWLSKRWMVRKP